MLALCRLVMPSGAERFDGSTNRKQMHPGEKRITILLLTCVLALGFNANAQSFLTNGLVAYYRLDGNASDASGNGNDGVVYGAVPAIDRFGVTNGCFSFDGNGQYISAPADGLPIVTRTISLWFKANRVDNRPGLFGYGGSSCGDSFFFGLNLAGYAPYVVSTHCDAYTLTVSYPRPLNVAWHHTVVVTDEGGTQLYLDCQLIGSHEGGPPETYVAGTDLGLGTISSPDGHTPYTDGNVGYLNGYMDDVRIYDRAFSAEEIQRLYDLESPICPEATIRMSESLSSEIEVCWASLSNRLYTVEYRSDFIGNTWLPLFRNVVGQCGVICVGDRLNQPQRFYRIICSTNSVAQ